MFPTVVNRIFMHFVTSRMKKAKDNSMPDIKQYFCFNRLILAENVASLGVMCVYFTKLDKRVKVAGPKHDLHEPH